MPRVVVGPVTAGDLKARLTVIELDRVDEAGSSGLERRHAP